LILILGALLAAELTNAAQNDKKTPFPPSRVSGKSFTPNKMMNTKLTPIKSYTNALKLGGKKNAGIVGDVQLDFCKGCIEFADQALEQLLNAIVNIGIAGSCSKLCNYVEEQTGNKFIGTACNIFCDYVGITEFVKLIDQADLDPIYYCELLKQCKINDNGDAKITKFQVSPNKGPQGTEFIFDLTYVSKNGTGTGEIYFGIQTVDGIPLEDSILLELQPAGTYNARLSVVSEPDPDCDPDQDECEEWLSGPYEAQIGLFLVVISSSFLFNQLSNLFQKLFVMVNAEAVTLIPNCTIRPPLVSQFFKSFLLI
jgi:hypothetical protein